MFFPKSFAWPLPVKIFVFLAGSFFLLFFFSSTTAEASPVVPGPVCRVTFEVLEVKRREVVPDRAVGEVIRGNDVGFEYYQVSLDGQSIATDLSQGDVECDSKYLQSLEDSGAILLPDDYQEVPLSKGAKVGAKVNYSGDEWFAGYFLSSVEIVEDLADGERHIAEVKHKAIGQDWFYLLLPLLLVSAGLYLMLNRLGRTREPA